MSKISYSTNNQFNLYIFLEHNKINPVKIFNDLDFTKNSIRKDTIGLSVVYIIFNKMTGDLYIGSASTYKFYSIFYRHMINLSGGKIVKLAINNI